MLSSNFLVIGSGIAGLTYALEVANHGTVIILCKSSPTEGNTQYAQGGIASVMSPLDSFDSHIKDTIFAGQGLCAEEVVKIVVEEGPKEIKKLIDYGTRFDKDPSDSFSLAKEGGHSERRILHAGDSTGAEILRAVFDAANNHPNITILSHHTAIDLILDRKSTPNKILGCYAFDQNKQTIQAFSANAIMMATGGVGKVYLYTSNPDIATGDGIAMAYRAGAVVSNMEFIQFHPTCLYHPQAKSFLITEAMRGEGAKLVLPNGESFMEQYDPRGELASRDIVAKAIDDQMKKHGYDHVFLDISHKDKNFLESRFPNIYKRCLELGFDLAKQPIPVVPAAHYCCGGIKTDIDGKTNIEGLYSAGECASTGLHGANRLASNSLLEAAVFASRAAKNSILANYHKKAMLAVPEWDYLLAKQSEEEVLVSFLWEEVRHIMWNLVGIVRSNKRLELAKKRIEGIQQEIGDYYWKFLVTNDLIELRNITLVAELIIKSALLRKESRGLHFNTDYPLRDDTNWCKYIELKQ
jgi:L-aspartate oxidase